MIKKISENIWKITCNSNIYILKDEGIAIDAGDKEYIDDVKDEIKEIIDPKKITKLLLTHLHYDHLGCIDLFPDAKVFASQQAISDYQLDPDGSILGPDFIHKFKIKLFPLPEEINNLKVIPTPGHTKGSVCFYLESEKILFSGDTLFSKDHPGRSDLPTSDPESYKNTLRSLPNYSLLLPGHDYDL